MSLFSLCLVCPCCIWCFVPFLSLFCLCWHCPCLIAPFFRDKQWQSLSGLVCPCLSLSVSVCPCLSLYVPFCPCMSLSVSICACYCLFLTVPVSPDPSLSDPVCPCLYLSILVCPCLKILKKKSKIHLDFRVLYSIRTLLWMYQKLERSFLQLEHRRREGEEGWGRGVCAWRGCMVVGNLEDFSNQSTFFSGLLL